MALAPSTKAFLYRRNTRHADKGAGLERVGLLEL